MSRRHWLSGYLFAVHVLTSTNMTHAAPPATPQVDEATAGAVKKFDAGRSAFEAGQFEQALVAFEASYSLAPSPNARLYIGRCYRALGKVASAYMTLRMAGREAQDRITATGEKRYGATRDAALTEAAALDAKVPRLTIAVPSDVPDGFVVQKNGADVPKALWGVAVETDPGELTVEANGPRLVPFKTAVKLGEGEQNRVDVKVARLPTATFGLHLATRPGGMTVEIDGAPVDISAAEAPREVDVGQHSVVVQAPGYVPFRWQKTLANADRAIVEVVLRADRSTTTIQTAKGTPKWLFFTVGAVAVAGLATASVVALDAKATKDEEIAKSPFDRSADTRDSIRSQATTANVLFVAGGALGVAAVVLAFTTQWSTPKSREMAVVPAPWMTTNGGGIGAHGAF